MDESNKSANSLRLDDIPYMGEGDSEDDIPDQEKSIDEEPFPNTVKILECGNGSKVYLIGTAHFR